MVVINKTDIDGETATKLLVKSTKAEYIKKFYFAIFLLVVGLPIMIYGLVQKESLYITFGATFIALSLVFTGYNLITIRRIPKAVKDKNENVCENGVKYDYKFKEHSVSFVATSGSKNSKYEYGYDSLAKIYEYPERYELKFKGNITLYVNKVGFQEKKMEEFFRHNVGTSKKQIKIRK